jgi:hypothetical protein
VLLFSDTIIYNEPNDDYIFDVQFYTRPTISDIPKNIIDHPKIKKQTIHIDHFNNKKNVAENIVLDRVSEQYDNIIHQIDGWEQYMFDQRNLDQIFELPIDINRICTHTTVTKQKIDYFSADPMKIEAVTSFDMLAAPVIVKNDSNKNGLQKYTPSVSLLCNYWGKVNPEISIFSQDKCSIIKYIIWWAIYFCARSILMSPDNQTTVSNFD